MIGWFEFPGASFFIKVPKLKSFWGPTSKSWNFCIVIYKKIEYCIAVNVVLYLKNRFYINNDRSNSIGNLCVCICVCSSMSSSWTPYFLFFVEESRAFYLSCVLVQSSSVFEIWSSGIRSLWSSEERVEIVF